MIDANYSEPTSVIKSTTILPAVAASLDKMGLSRSPIAFASPNLLELAQMYQASRSDPSDLTAHQSWWSVIDKFSLDSAFRMDLEQLARRNVSDDDSLKGTLSFLVDKGIAQMAVNLLPFFQNLVIKCGAQGVIVASRISGPDVRTSGWVQERSNPRGRYVVAHGKSSAEMIVLQHVQALAFAKDKLISVTGAGDSLVGSVLASLVQRPQGFHDPNTLKDIINAGQRAAILTLQSKNAVSPLLSVAQ